MKFDYIECLYFSIYNILNGNIKLSVILLIHKILLSFLLHTINHSALAKIQLYVLNYVVNFI